MAITINRSNILINKSIISINTQDIDVFNFINETGIVDLTLISSISNLVTSAKENGWWEKCDIIYPFIGGNSLSHSINLKNTTIYDINFSGTWSHDNNGITGDGSTSYGDTGLIPATNLIESDTHVSIYSRTNDSGSVIISDFGCGDDVIPPGNSPRIGTHLCFLGSLYSDQYDVDNNRVAISNSNSLGYYIQTRSTSTSQKVYKNGIDMGGENTNASNGFENILFSMYIGASNTNGTPQNFSNRNYSFFTIGNGISDSLALLMYNDIQTFQISLGRDV